MLTLEEIKNINKAYRFKYDFNSKTFALINSATKEPVTDAEEINIAKAGILLSNLIHNGITPSGALGLASVDNKFFNTQDLDIRAELFLNSLVSDLKTIIQSQQYSVNMSLSTYKTPIDYFIANYKSSSTQDYIRDCYSALIDLVGKENGMKVDNFDISIQPSGVETEFKCSTCILSQQYSNIANNTSSNSASRRKFVETLIEKYKQCEDDANYDIRKNFEDRTMQKVVDVSNGTILFTQLPTDIHKFMRMLISAQNLSITGERDFLEEVISIDIVNQRLLELHEDKSFQKQVDEKIAFKKSKNEKLGHVETEAEVNLRLANSSAKNHTEEFEKLKYAIENGKAIIFESTQDGQRCKRIASLYAKTQGQFELFKDTESSIS